jgi:hypothetical protein
LASAWPLRSAAIERAVLKLIKCVTIAAQATKEIAGGNARANLKNMRNFASAGWFQAFIVLIVASGAACLNVRADDRFSIVVGRHSDLVIFGAKGQKVADLPLPSIAQTVTVDPKTLLVVSYGQDANQRLTAILSPTATQPAHFHFTVLDKDIDADRAVVTLTFSRGLSRVTVDPGSVGRVEVNSDRISHRALSGGSYPAVPSPEHRRAPASFRPPPPLMNTQLSPRELPPES